MANAGESAQERVEIRYGSRNGDGETEVELPFRLLFVGDFTLRPDETPVGERPLIEFDRERLVEVMEGFGLSLDTAADGDEAAAEPPYRLKFSGLDDFSPDSLASQVPAMAVLRQARRDLVALRAEGSDSESRQKALAEIASRSGVAGPFEGRGEAAAERTPHVRAEIDRMIAELDRRIAALLRNIMEDERLRALETAWRSLSFVAERSAGLPNVRLCLISISKEELLADFEDSPEVGKSGLFRQIHKTGFADAGGEPVSAVICGYEFGPRGFDVKLAQYCASVGALVHAPFIAGASPAMFGIERFADLPPEPGSALRGPAYAKWNVFRKSADARHFALVLPRFLLRGSPDAGRAAGGSGLLWGNAAYAFAVALIERFGRNGWRMDRSPRDRKSSGGGPEERDGVPCPHPVTDVLLTDRKERALAEEGFIAFARRRADEGAFFFSAPAVRHERARPADAMDAVANSLYFTLMCDRLTQYLKVVQRENGATWRGGAETETELNNWIRQYAAPGEGSSRSPEARHPLRKAEVNVSEVAGEPGWLAFEVAVQPRFRYMGAELKLAASGKFDRPHIGKPHSGRSHE